MAVILLDLLVAMLAVVLSDDILNVLRIVDVFSMQYERTKLCRILVFVLIVSRISMKCG